MLLRADVQAETGRLALLRSDQYSKQCLALVPSLVECWAKTPLNSYSHVEPGEPL